MKNNKDNSMFHWEIVKLLKKPIERREMNYKPEELKEVVYNYEIIAFFISIALVYSSLNKNTLLSLCIAFLQSIIYIFYLFLSFIVKPRDFSPIHIWIAVIMTSAFFLSLLKCVYVIFWMR